MQADVGVVVVDGDAVTSEVPPRTASATTAAATAMVTRGRAVSS